jgi:hypothetical protein
MTTESHPFPRWTAPRTKVPTGPIRWRSRSTPPGFEIRRTCNCRLACGPRRGAQLCSSG